MTTWRNKVLICKTQNLSSVDVDLASTGLATDATLKVVLETDDGSSDHVLIQGWPSTPSDVLRDSVSQVGMGTYTYDAQLQELLILEWDAALHIWEIVP